MVPRGQNDPRYAGYEVMYSTDSSFLVLIEQFIRYAPQKLSLNDSTGAMAQNFSHMMSSYW